MQSLLTQSWYGIRKGLSQADAISSVHHLIAGHMIREKISKIENRKAPGPSGLVFKMVKSAGEEHLINNIKVEGAITVERELSILSGCFREIVKRQWGVS